MDEKAVKVVCFSCKFSWGYLNPGAMEEDLLYWIPVTCSGKIGAEHILRVFGKGADGVLILACPEGDCHFQDGNFKIEAKVQLIQKVLTAHGIEPERLRLHLESDPEGGRIKKFIWEMKKQIALLGPLSIAGSAAGQGA